MNKQTLNDLSKLITELTPFKPNKKEDLNSFVKRAYDGIYDKLEDLSDKETIQSIISDLESDMQTAVFALPVRRSIVEAWCKANDPVEISEPEDASDDDILAHNGFTASAEEMQKVMPKKDFENLMAKLRVPKSKGLGKREREAIIERHYAKYQPLFPSEKTFTHNGNEGSTFGYHWAGAIQDEYVADHQKFVAEFDLSDRFIKVEDETESE